MIDQDCLLRSRGEAQPSGMGTGPATVLVVDDDRQIRLMLRRMVAYSDLDIEVIGEASDGVEALRLHAELLPNAVFLDNRMPGPDGLSVARRMLKRDPSVRIVLFSGTTDEGVVAAARQVGITDVVSKIDTEALWSVLGSIFQTTAEP